jgi:hypothetical protein
VITASVASEDGALDPGTQRTVVRDPPTRAPLTRAGASVDTEA